MRTISPTYSRLVYPCLITSLCRAQKVPRSRCLHNGKLEPGDISNKTVNMSDSQVKRKVPHDGSAPPYSYAPGPSGGLGDMPSASNGRPLLDKPRKGLNMKGLMRKILCGQRAQMKSDIKAKAERRAMAKRIEEDFAWQKRQLELKGLVTEPYDPVPLVIREPSDDYSGPDDYISD